MEKTKAKWKWWWSWGVVRNKWLILKWGRVMSFGLTQLGSLEPSDHLYRMETRSKLSWTLALISMAKIISYSSGLYRLQLAVLQPSSVNEPIFYTNLYNNIWPRLFDRTRSEIGGIQLIDYFIWIIWYIQLYICSRLIIHFKRIISCILSYRELLFISPEIINYKWLIVQSPSVFM